MENKIVYSKLSKSLIEINWNKKPIEMNLFLSFLTVEVTVNKDHMGYDMGWTQRLNKEYNLIIRGGWVNGKEYLDSIQFGKNLDNPYNNYVNPFYLEDIMIIEGKQFFIDYYKEEIDKLKQDNIKNIENLTKRLEEAKENQKTVTNIINNFVK